MMNRILIIDGNNLAHRAQHKFQLSTAEGKPSSVVYGFIYILGSLARRFPSDEIYTVFDGGRSPFRMGLLPTYKARENRMDDEGYKAFVDQLDFLKRNLSMLNCRVAHKEGQEADDIIFKIIRNNPKSYRTIVSSDKDFVQLLKENVKIFNPFKDSIITPVNALKECGYSPTECVDYLCLDGDKSDKIPGVPGMGPKRIREFLDTFGSIEDYLELDKPDPKWVRYDAAIREVAPLNRKLISLSSYFVHYGKKEELRVKPAMENFQTLSALLLKEYQVRLLTKPEFLKPFTKLV